MRSHTLLCLLKHLNRTGSEYNTECIFFCCTTLMETSTYTKQLHKARENRFRFMEHELGGCFLLYSEIHRPFWVWSGPWPIRPACSSEGPSITGPRLQPGDRFALPQLTHPSALAPLHTQATWRGPARPGNVTLFQTCQMPEISTMKPATRGCFTAFL